MSTPFVYFAHPVDFTEARAVANELVRQMRIADLAIYDPEPAFLIPPSAEPSDKLTNINRAVLPQCDAVVAYLPGDTRSVGVPREIEQAVAEGKPLLVVSDGDTFRRSWALPQESDDVRHATVQPNGNQVASGLGWLWGRVRALRSQRKRPTPSQAVFFALEPGAALPTRAYEGDAGFDLYTLDTVNIPANGFVDVSVGCAVQMPDRVWGMITGRSSTLRTHRLLVTTGIIDTGYRGPLYAGVQSLRDHDYTVKRGERLAQLIPYPNVAMSLHAVQVDVLSPSSRGDAGFGSSGA